MVVKNSRQEGPILIDDLFWRPHRAAQRKTIYGQTPLEGRRDLDVRTPRITQCNSDQCTLKPDQRAACSYRVEPSPTFARFDAGNPKTKSRWPLRSSKRVVKRAINKGRQDRSALDSSISADHY